jgi:hypothetical protein
MAVSADYVLQVYVLLVTVLLIIKPYHRRDSAEILHYIKT